MLCVVVHPSRLSGLKRALKSTQLLVSGVILACLVYVNATIDHAKAEPIGSAQNQFSNTSMGVAYSTFLGGSQTDEVRDMAVDANGYIYVIGNTSSSDFPTANALQGEYAGNGDAFVAKFSPDGSELIYSTYLGGTDLEYADGVAVDKQGNAYVVGFTTSKDFPLANPFQAQNLGSANAFVAKLDSTGQNLLYSTYLGGTLDHQGKAADDRAHAVVVDDQGAAYVVGGATAIDFPLAHPYQSEQLGWTDAFVARFSPDGSSLDFSTFLGASGSDEAYGVGIDALGRVTVAGSTSSFDFPAVQPLQSAYAGGYSDGFVARFAFDGTSSNLDYSTYLGGSGNESILDLELDGDGRAYMTGNTDSADFPGPGQSYGGAKAGQAESAPPAQPAIAGGYDAFVVALQPSGTEMLYSTYLGGSSNDSGFAIDVDGEHRAYVIGSTLSEDFPTRNAGQPSTAGFWDAFVTSIDPTGARLLHSTYIGGQNTDWGSSLALDSQARVYIAGYSDSPDFPTAAPVQADLKDSQDAFVARLDTSQETGPGDCAIQFADVPEGSAFYPYVRCLACAKIVGGYPCGGDAEPCGANNQPYYRPGESLTRAQMSKIVSQAAGLTPGAGGQRFEDVPSDSPFYTWINSMANAGVVSGYTCGTLPDEPCVGPGNLPYFRPASVASRGQFAKVISQAAGLSGMPQGQTFGDIPPGQTYYEYIERLAAQRPGTFSGYTCGQLPSESCDEENRPFFRPGNNVTRGQAAKIVSEALALPCSESQVAATTK